MIKNKALKPITLLLTVTVAVPDFEIVHEKTQGGIILIWESDGHVGIKLGIQEDEWISPRGQRTLNKV